MSDRLFARIRTFLAVFAALWLVAGCGGGGGGDGNGVTTVTGVGSGGTGAGVVTGFGSLIIDGVRRDDSQANYLSEINQGWGVSMAPTAAMLGHSVEFAYDAGGNMRSVLISPELLGIVTAVAADSVTVLGTRITANSDLAAGPVTHFVGYAALADIKVGDRIEAHGLLKTDAQGQVSLQAALIVQKTSGSGSRLTGYVSQYSATSNSLVLNGTTVTTGSATITPASTTLANGQLVTVWSDLASSDGTLVANIIRIKQPAGGTLALSGAVSGYASAASFTVRNVVVDAANAAISPAGSTLANGTYVVVVGTYDATGNKLAATSVTVFTAAATNPVELHGTVLNYVSASSFTVRGVVVDASAAQFSGGTAAQLANGIFIRVTGSIANNAVRAATVQVVTLDPLQVPVGSMLNLGGMISSFNPATGAYTMAMGSGAMLSGTLGQTAFYDNGASADFAVGQTVTVTGRMNNGMLATSVVGFGQSPGTTGSSTPAPATPVPVSYMEGIVSGVTPGSFMLNGIAIQRNGATVGGRGMMAGRPLVGGSRVAVDVQFSGGQYQATAISLLN